MNEIEIEKKKRKNVEALYLKVEGELKELKANLQVDKHGRQKLVCPKCEQEWNGKRTVVEPDPELEADDDPVALF